MTELRGRVAAGSLAMAALLLVAVSYLVSVPTKREPVKPPAASNIVVVADHAPVPQDSRAVAPFMTAPTTSPVSVTALPTAADDDVTADLPADLSRMEGRSDRTGPPTAAYDGIGGRPDSLPSTGEPLSPP